MRSRVEAGLVSSSAAFLPGEQCVVLSQQRCFKSGCWSYPTKGVEPDDFLLMKLPFCCCCRLFCKQAVMEICLCLAEGCCSLGDSLTVWGHLLCAGLPEGSHMHMWLYVCVYIYAHCWNTILLTKDPVLFQDCDDPRHLLVGIY